MIFSDPLPEIPDKVAPYLSSSSTRRFNVTQSTIPNIVYGFLDMWADPGSKISNVSLSQPGSNWAVPYDTAGEDAELRFGLPIMKPFLDMNGQDGVFATVATSLTCALRNADNATKLGTSSPWVVYVRVQWPLLVLPLCLIMANNHLHLCVGSRVTLVKISVWTTDTVPLLLHGLSSDARTKLRELQVSMAGE